MSYYSELNTGTQKVLNLLIANQDLCKLLYYNDKDPLSQDDITDTSSLILTKIFPFPKIPDIQTVACTNLNVFFDDISPNSRNSGFRNETLKIAVIMHIDVFLIKGGIRVYSVMEQLDQIFNDKYYPEIAGHNLRQVGTARATQFNNNYYGYVLQYGFKSDSNLSSS